MSEERNAPEDKRLSSGRSVVYENVDEIDNHNNVSNYVYGITKKNDVASTNYSLTDFEYDFWEEIEILSEDEYPQGICLTAEYLCISSYSEEDEDLGKIRFFDRKSGEILLTLGIDERSHLGGIAYDGKYLWVCNSSKKSIESIPYVFVQDMIKEHKGEYIDVRNIVDVYRVNNTPSCITYYDGMLWVASHSIFTDGKMISYRYDEQKDVLEKVKGYWIPSKVQGVAFGEYGEVILSTSYGRNKSSYIKHYVSVEKMTKDVDAYVECIELPPCSEEIVYENGKIYVLFESAGKKYLEGTDGNGKSIAPINKILIINR